ncbi:CDP-alcohol phosphatidyltransferase [Trypanosoma melophagium]|uniref:CDP-alcohol phosphatidyltransferase n=1 Tax=Trypanosoma melophagium TaxID=715481 RepID=UPI003519FEAF|nr:CDP-alcohol phosphatidyltransferase [Trypanosoma melophagium]
MEFLISVSSKDNSPDIPPQQSYLAEYILSPIYDKIASSYPSTWTPNKVTLFGIFSTLLASLLLFTGMPSSTVFDPPYGTYVPISLLKNKGVKSEGNVVFSPLHPAALKPLWSSIFPNGNMMLFVCGLLNIIYCIADNTDGRLARRLKKSSNIGEYLDHGLDCVTSLLSTCVSMSIIGISFSNITVTVLPIAIATVFSHTLHYEKNIFIWGNRFISVDEAMIFFGLANWIIILFPQIGAATVSSGFLHMFLPDEWAQMLHPLLCIEVVMIVYWVSQLSVIMGMVLKNVMMLFRLTTITLVMNTIVLLGLIPVHMRHIAAEGTGGYAWGPFSYVAVWCFTAACTSSTVVHILIYARCMRLPQVDLWPISGVIFVWLIFVSCPVGGMVLSVAWHLAQILKNVQGLIKAAQKTKSA